MGPAWGWGDDRKERRACGGKGRGRAPALKAAPGPTSACRQCEKPRRVGQSWFPLSWPEGFSQASQTPSILGPHPLRHGRDSCKALGVRGGWTDRHPIQEAGAQPQETALQCCPAGTGPHAAVVGGWTGCPGLVPAAAALAPRGDWCPAAGKHHWGGGGDLQANVTEHLYVCVCKDGGQTKSSPRQANSPLGPQFPHP